MLKKYAQIRKAVVAALTAAAGFVELALVDNVLTQAEVTRAVLAALATGFLTYSVPNDTPAS